MQQNGHIFTQNLQLYVRIDLCDLVMEEFHYNKLNDFYRKKFGSKVFKISLDAGFSCPNKDGKKGIGGCIFCNGSVNIGSPLDSIEVQFEKIKTQLEKKWKDGKYIAYFEANTNTYAELAVLKELYERVLGFEGVVGLAIATRCDSISEEVYDYLEKLNKKTYLSIELGLQSAHDSTLRFINRGHTVSEFTDCVRELKRRNIEVVVHIINGLPYETREMMLDTARYVNSLKVSGIKFHMLYIERNTALEKMYRDGSFSLLSKDEYIDILAKQIELLDESIVVHRLVSGPNNATLLEPTWLLGKFRLLNDIENYFKSHRILQGSKKEIDY